MVQSSALLSAASLSAELVKLELERPALRSIAPELAEVDAKIREVRRRLVPALLDASREARDNGEHELALQLVEQYAAHDRLARRYDEAGSSLSAPRSSRTAQ